MLYTQTAFSQAIFLMFENLDSWLKENYQNLPHHAVKVYLFGGCAMHLHTGTRTSNDVDAQLQSISILQPIHTIEKAIQSVDFDDESGLPRSLDWDGGFNLSIAPIDPDYEERAILIHTTKSNLVDLYLVSAVDIAVSKLGRLESVDRTDIKTLYQQGLFTEEEFIQATTEATKYCAVAPDKLEFNVELAINFLREESR